MAEPEPARMALIGSVMTAHDLDNLIAVELVEYDAEKARRALEATVALILDAEEQEALKARKAEKKRHGTRSSA